MRYSQHVSQKQTPQSEPIMGKNQVRNSAGGFVFALDDWKRLERFLILGSEGGTYYTTERKLTKENAECVLRCAKDDPVRTIKTIVEISDAGRAPKNDPAIFALALIAKTAEDHVVRAEAYRALPRVCRTGTHLLQFLATVRDLGGFGAGFRRAITKWYFSRPAKDMAYQVIKYQNREGENHRTALRLAHPGVYHQLDESQKAIMHYVMKGWDSVGEEPHSDENLRLLWAFERAKHLKTKADVSELVQLITHYRMPHECIPTEMRAYPEVWDAMLHHGMGVTAIIRNLGKMTQVGLLKPLSQATNFVQEKLLDPEQLSKGRVHPLALLVALKTYAQGRGMKGSLTWSPIPQITDTLDRAFYLAFKAITPAGARMVLGIDVSGSMDGGSIAGSLLTPREGAATMALVSAATEPFTVAMGFSTTFVQLNISPRIRLDTVVKTMQGLPFQGTDCAQPMLWAMQNKIEADLFAVYTDNETWAGSIHPKQALDQYRQKTGIPAKLVVAGMTSTGFTIADPSDAGMLDVVGFDTAAPAVISDFARS